MFFKLSTNKDQSFSNHYTFDKFYLSTDAGWSEHNINDTHVVIKGYVDDRPIDDSLLREIVLDPTPKFKGNFIAVVGKHDGITVTHDVCRASQMLINDQSITNLPSDGYERLWADRYPVIVNDIIDTIKFLDKDKSNIKQRSREQILRELHTLLTDKIKTFLEHNQLPVKVFLSGGLDTMLVYSFLKDLTNDYELCGYEHTEYTEFYAKNKHRLDTLWGYKWGIHNWLEPSVLTTGSCGDEFMLRTPSHLQLFLMHWNLSIDDVLAPEHHQYKYLNQPSYREKYEQQKADPLWKAISQDYNRIADYILKVNRDDNQHWHLEKTLTFTPLRDLDITKLMLQLPKEDIIGQIVNGDITRSLIAMNDESLLEYLSDQKNNSNQEHLWKLYAKN